MKTPAMIAVLLALPLLLTAQPPADTPPARPGWDRPPRERMERERPPRGQPFLDRWMNHLEQEDPEEHQRLRQLQEEDPAAFRGEVRESFSRSRERAVAREPRASPFAEEVAAIHGAETEEAREEAVKRLRERMEERVEQRMAMRERRMEAIRAQLEQLEAQHKQDLDRREELVNSLMENLLHNLEAPGEPPPQP